MSDMVCLICREEEGDFLTRCNHHFHLDCLDFWFKKQNGTCPLCRGPLTNIQVVEDYVSKRITTKNLSTLFIDRNSPTMTNFNIDRRFVNWIVCSGDVRLMAELAKNKVDMTEEATRYKRMDLLSFLLKNHPYQSKAIDFMCEKGVNSIEDTIILASTSGRLDLIKCLLDNEQQYYLLPQVIQSAVQAEHKHIIKYLVKDMKIKYPENIIDTAVRHNQSKMVQYLLDLGLTYTPDVIAHAAIIGNFEILKILMKQNGSCLCLPLRAIIYATFKGNFEIVKYLLEKGGISSNDIEAVIDFAIEQKQMAIAELLNASTKAKVNSNSNGSHLNVRDH